MNEPKTMRTTTLEIERPTDFSILEREFRLVYYPLPSSYVKAPKKSHKYQKLHIQLKNQLQQPYKTYDYAIINEETVPVVYVLYRRSDIANLDEQPKELKWSTQKMQPVDIDFDHIPFHILIKLLQADYFRGDYERTFISQGDFFILAKHGREGNGAVCLLIEVKGDRRNTDDMTIQAFQVTGSARKFVKITDPNDPKQLPKDSEKTTPYFRRETRQTEIIFSQVKQKEFAEFIEARRPLFKIKRRKDKKPSLPYHDQLNLFISRGGILYTFIENFCAYLGEKGLVAKPKFRTLSKFSADQNYANLPISELGKIHIFDNRIDKDPQQLEDFLILLNRWLKEESYQVEFELVSSIVDASRIPTLLLQDHEKKDFVKGGRFFEQGITNDPKQAIYSDPKYKNTPKQSLNLATEIDLKARKLRIHVALNQLLLKDLIMNRRSVNGILPGFSSSEDYPKQLSLFPDFDPTPLRDYAFVRRKTYDGESRTTLVQFRNDHLEFIDVSDDFKMLYQVSERMNLDWDEIYLELHRINFRVKNGVIDEGRELKRFDLVLSSGQALVIEDIHETVLYEYTKMDERQKRLIEPIPLDDFRLLERARPKNQAQYKQFQRFEAFLDELAEELPYGRISFRDLTEGEFGVRIGEIFELPKNDKDKFKFGNFKMIYQQPELNMFLSDKATSLHTYQGIWYDGDNRYLVGEPDGIKRKQATANLLRQFTVLVGHMDVDIKSLLSTTGVQFIRPKRYTVYPYFFNLINMFVESRG